MSHFEKYKVTSKSVSGDKITFGVTALVVPDDPVSTIIFRDFLPGGNPSLTGTENPVDDTAVIFANHTDWQSVRDTVNANTHFVRYLSSPGASPSTENITNVSWGLL